MKSLNQKKVWFFLLLIAVTMTTVCIININKQQKKVFAGGRIVWNYCEPKYICRVEE